MASWRAEVGSEAQSDFDGLLGPCLELAQQALSTRKTLYPFAVVVGLDGTQRVALLDPESETNTDGNVVLGQFDNLLADQREINRAYALVFDTRLPARSSDAIQLQLEHHEGSSIIIQIPYAYQGLRRRLTFGEMIVSLRTATTWPVPR